MSQDLAGLRESVTSSSNCLLGIKPHTHTRIVPERPLIIFNNPSAPLLSMRSLTAIKLYVLIPLAVVMGGVVLFGDQFHGQKVHEVHRLSYQINLTDWDNNTKEKVDVLSYSLYGSDPRYTEGVLHNSKLYHQIYPGWQMRVYHDNSVPVSIITELTNNGVDMHNMSTSKQNKRSWRFLASIDPNVDKFCSRDCDSRLSLRERVAVLEWENSNYSFHVMRDHPSHALFGMSAGMWCSRVNFTNVFIDLPKSEDFFADTNWLNSHLWPVVSKNVLQHDSFSCLQYAGSRPFPVARRGWEHVGSVYIDGKLRESDVDVLRRTKQPEACRDRISYSDKSLHKLMSKNTESHATKTWVSMSICLDQNTELHGKSATPYHQAAILSSWVWQNRVEVNVVVQVVSSMITIENHNIVQTLKKQDTLVKHTQNLSSLDCPTSSQVARLGAYKFPEISSNDLIIVADVDAFPISKHVFDPLIFFPQRKVWVWQHLYSEQSGDTFPISFIAMRSSDWSTIFDCNIIDDPKCIPNWKAYASPAVENSIWGLDQRMITKALLKKHRCSVNNEMVWKRVGLSFEPFDDSLICFHGDANHRHGEMDPSKRHWIHMRRESTISDVRLALGLHNTNCTQKIKFRDIGGVQVATAKEEVPRADGDEAIQSIVDNIEDSPRSHGIVVDVGGLYGDFGLQAASKLRQPTYIFEPQNCFVNLIQESIWKNNMNNFVFVKHAAISPSKSVQMQTVNADGLVHITKHNTQSITVQGISLDEEFQTKTILLLKIDVEGYEGDVLQTMNKIFQEQRIQNIIFEYTPYQFQHRGTDYEQLISTMYARGAIQCFALHRKKPFLYAVSKNNSYAFYMAMLESHMQTDIWCSFNNNVTICPYKNCFVWNADVNLLTNNGGKTWKQTNHLGVTANNVQCNSNYSRSVTNNPNAIYQMLITGCGYSATGFYAKAFQLAGYNIGHEQKGRDGSSAWIAIAQNDTREFAWNPTEEFQHIFMLVRHPLKVIQSQKSTKWDFIIRNQGISGQIDISMEVNMDKKQFEKMRAEFKTLIWWTTFTERAYKISQCYMRAEDSSPQQLKELCINAHFKNCNKVDWLTIFRNVRFTNSHRCHDIKKKNEFEECIHQTPTQLQWPKAETEHEHFIVDRALKLCKKFYTDCNNN